jgi:hypothetical protein
LLARKSLKVAQEIPNALGNFVDHIPPGLRHELDPLPN